MQFCFGVAFADLDVNPWCLRASRNRQQVGGGLLAPRAPWGFGGLTRPSLILPAPVPLISHPFPIKLPLYSPLVYTLMGAAKNLEGAARSDHEL